MFQGPRQLSEGNTPLTEADMIQFDKGLVEVKVSKVQEKSGCYVHLEKGIYQHA